MPQAVKITSKLFPGDYNKPYGTLAIKLPMNANIHDNKAGLFNMSYTTEEQAISNYINLLLTKSGERYMQPNFGVGLYYYIFEPNDDVMNDFLETEIKNQVAMWLPYIERNNVTIYHNDGSNENEHGVNIVINFSVGESGANRTITVFGSGTDVLNLDIS